MVSSEFFCFIYTSGTFISKTIKVLFNVSIVMFQFKLYGYKSDMCTNIQNKK